MVNMGTGAATTSLVTTYTIINIALGGAVGAANTAAANWIYGENKSVQNAFLYGSLFGGLGTAGGKIITWGGNSISPTYIGGKPLNPSVPILLQNVGKPNPYPGYIGDIIRQGISNYPSFSDLGEKDKK